MPLMQAFLPPPLTTSRSTKPLRCTSTPLTRPTPSQPARRLEPTLKTSKLTASRPTPKKRRAPPHDVHSEKKSNSLTPQQHTNIIHMLAKNGNLSQMRAAIEAAVNNGFVLNAVNFTTIANAYATSSKPWVALSTLAKMKEKEIKPTNVTLRVAIKACERVKGSGSDLMQILEWMWEKGEKPEVKTLNLALRALARLGEVSKMCELIMKMREKGPAPDVWSYNAVLHALGVEGRLVEAFEMWGSMVVQGVKPDVVSYNTILEMCIGIRKWPFEDAETSPEKFLHSLLGSMQRRGVSPNLTTETLLLRLLCRKRVVTVNEALVQQRKNIVLKGKHTPDKKYFDALLHAFANTRNMSAVADVYHLMRSYKISPDIHTVRAVLHSASMAGEKTLAVRIIDILKSNHYPLDNILYTSAIAACARHIPPDAETASSLLKHAQSCNVAWTAPMLNATLASYGSDSNGAVACWKELRATPHRPSRLALSHREVYDALFRVCGRAGRPDFALRIFYAAKQAKHIAPNSPSSRSLFNAFQKGVMENNVTLRGPYMQLLRTECGARDDSFPIERIRIKL